MLPCLFVLFCAGWPGLLLRLHETPNLGVHQTGSGPVFIFTLQTRRYCRYPQPRRNLVGVVGSSVANSPAKLCHASRLPLGTPMMTGIPRSMALAIRSRNPPPSHSILPNLLRTRSCGARPKASLDPCGGFRQRRLVQTASARAGAAVLEQGGAMAGGHLPEPHRIAGLRPQRPDAARRRPASSPIARPRLDERAEYRVGIDFVRVDDRCDPGEALGMPPHRHDG